MSDPVPYYQVRALSDFPGYEIDEFGRVFSTKRAARIEIRQHKMKDDYANVILFKDGVRHTKLVHRLVLQTFVGNAPDGYIARHLDGNKNNNVLSNLKWGTPLENIADKTKHGTQTRGSDVVVSKLSKGDVEWIRAYPDVPGKYSKIARRLQVSPKAIKDILTGRTWGHV